MGAGAADRDQTPCCGDLRGRRSAGLPVGAAAGWACGLLEPRAGLLRRRRTSFLFNVQVLGRLRQGADSEGWSVPTRITGQESASGCSRGCRTGALPGAAPCPLPEGSGGNCAHPTPHHPATRARSLSSRPCFGTSHQTPHPCAPPLCHLPRADWTSRFSARRRTARGR